MALRLETPVQFAKGVGPKLGESLARRGVRSVGDLVEYYPRAYEDQRAARNIASLQPDEIVSLRASIVDVKSYFLGKTRRRIFDVTVGDSSGRIHCKFFRIPYKGYFDRFQPHQEVRVVGKVTLYQGRKEFHHPDIKDLEMDLANQNSVVPIYVETEGLSQGKILKLIESAWEQLDKSELERLPRWLCQKYHLVSREEALFKLHHPESDRAAEYAAMKSSSHRRLIFEEFFWLELFLAARRAGFVKQKAPILSAAGEGVKSLMNSLPFQLTQAQLRAFEDIRKDFKKGSPMHRMVQGDVGSGKTLVAFLAAMDTTECGYQTALMAPTEILAEQHFKNADRYLSACGVRTALLTGKTKTAERKKIFEDLQSGAIDFLIGTHAIIENNVVFHQLGLVIVDEQHRFGVEQRGGLKNKGQAPHFLVMTATPIPRTLAMTVYGDLDVSLINEMPPGRSPIQTRVTFESKRVLALEFMIEQIKKGRQAYIVYPLVEESEKIDLKDAITQFEKLKIQFPQIRFELLHGRMKPEEKADVMARFRAGEVQVLVSTTVIEVGVDVPNANIMVIEHAERFGLAQLHQLRGRVGRGEHKSFCILILGYAVGPDAHSRLMIMEDTTDGFRIAEKDLEIRGPGEFLGKRQAGMAGFKMAHLVRDVDILQQAREAAFEVLKKDPQLKGLDAQSLRNELLRKNGPTSLAGIA